MIAKVHTTNEMADDIEDIFVWGEDFEAILANLEEHETVDLHLTSASNEASINLSSSRLVNEHLRLVCLSVLGIESHVSFII